jgi:hypothetical protein
LSQKARQPRKASKKALEEMSRETQRMSRNMQLAHQAQTKKKMRPLALRLSLALPIQGSPPLPTCRRKARQKQLKNRPTSR